MSAYMNGAYFLRALGASFGKRSNKYPTSLMFQIDDKKELSYEEKTKLAAERFEAFSQVFNQKFK